MTLLFADSVHLILIMFCLESVVFHFLPSTKFRVTKDMSDEDKLWLKVFDNMAPNNMAPNNMFIQSFTLWWSQFEFWFRRDHFSLINVQNSMVFFPNQKIRVFRGYICQIYFEKCEVCLIKLHFHRINVLRKKRVYLIVDGIYCDQIFSSEHHRDSFIHTVEEKK